MHGIRRQLKWSRMWWLVLPYLVLAVGAGFLHTCGGNCHGAQLTDHAKACAACAWSRTQATETVSQPVCVVSETVEQTAPIVLPSYHHAPCVRLASRAPPVI